MGNIFIKILIVLGLGVLGKCFPSQTVILNEVIKADSLNHNSTENVDQDEFWKLDSKEDLKPASNKDAIVTILSVSKPAVYENPSENENGVRTRRSPHRHHGHHRSHYGGWGGYSGGWGDNYYGGWGRHGHHRHHYG